MPAGRAQQRGDDLLGGAGVGRRLEHEQVAGREDRADRAGRGLDGGQVGLAVGERGRDADDVRRAVGRHLPGDGEAGSGEVGVADVLDPGAAADELGDPGGRAVVADDRDAGAGQRDGERQPDVAQPDDADLHRVILAHQRGTTVALSAG